MRLLQQRAIHSELHSFELILIFLGNPFGRSDKAEISEMIIPEKRHSVPDRGMRNSSE